MEVIKKAPATALALVLLAAAGVGGNPVFVSPHGEPADSGGFDVGKGKTATILFVIFAAALLITVIAVAALSFILRITAKSFREAAPVNFAAEDVHITLTGAGAKVNGFYTFHNPHDNDKTVRLAYPFANDEGIGEPKYIMVEDERREMLPFDTKYGILTFKTRVPAGGKAVVRVAFEQSCYAGKFRYILTTTHEWKRPLEYAHFFVETPAAFEPLESTYPLIPTSGNAEVVTYELYRENFWPEKDFILTWAKAGDVTEVTTTGSVKDVDAAAKRLVVAK